MSVFVIEMPANLFTVLEYLQHCFRSTISNPTMRTGLEFKSAQSDPVRGEAEYWTQLRGLEI